MNTENLQTLKIHKLTQAQYDRELAAGNIDESALYLTPDEKIDLSPYATIEQVNTKADVNHNHNDVYYTETEVDTLFSDYYTGAEVDTLLFGKSDADHNHDSDYDEKGSASAAVGTHNASTSAHNDIRESITNHISDKSNPHGVTLSQLGVNATATELNVLDGITATTTELNYMDGVTSNVQTQLDGKSDTSHTHDEYMTSVNPVGSGSFSVNRKANTTVGTRSSTLGGSCTASGDYSHAEGYLTTASGNFSHAEGHSSVASVLYSHAEGSGTAAEGYASHAEGYDNTASGSYSHAEGYDNAASGICSHAEGWTTIASGDYSHAEGYYTTASGTTSHAAGHYTTADNYQYVVGKYNSSRNPITSVDTVYSTSDSVTTTYPALFIIGNGTSDTSRSNAFTVYANGKCKGLSSFGSSGADYARQYEWLDGNPNNEDRRGLLVVLDGSKIRIATPDDDIEDCEGIVSTCPAFVENDPDEWHDRYLKDVFGRRITQEVIIPEETITKSVEKIDEETGKTVIEEVTEVIPEHTIIQFVVNPEYDPEQEYICRDVRPEWTVVGFSGFIVAVDDGTCQVNGYCTTGENGVLTMSEIRTAYRVMERKDDNHILVRIK